MARLALVTGAANGIGADIAAALHGAGYDVAVLDLDGGQVQARCTALPGARGLIASVTDEVAVSAAFDELGTVPDLVVNNAGIVRFGALAELAVQDFRQAIEINLTGAFIVTREATRRMLSRGSGHVISLTSINAYSPGPGSGAYPASKIALRQLMKQFAVEYGDQGIRYNCIAPGFIDGGMSAPIYADPKVRAARSAGVPLRRLGTPEDVSNAVLFLDSGKADYIHGEELVIDGGVIHNVLKLLPRS